jgi:uncharacterized DUF497 family protein
VYDNIDVPIDGIEWDSEKARLNLEKHKVSFETAQYVFADPERLERLDQSEKNTFGEERLQTLGRVGKVLFVVYTERGNNKHIISARLAYKNDRRSYNGYYQIDGKGWTKAL